MDQIYQYLHSIRRSVAQLVYIKISQFNIKSEKSSLKVILYNRHQIMKNLNTVDRI